MAKVRSALVRSSSARGSSSLAPARLDPQVRVNSLPDVQTRTVDEIENRLNGPKLADPSAALIEDFIAPSSRTTAWLTNPKLTATLEAASESLAPGGATEDPIDRYAASVVETHLVARRRLSNLMNSLLKT